MIDMADSKVEYPAPDCLAPAAIEAKTETAGVTKANLPVAKAFLLAMFAGAFIAFGGLFFTVFLSDSTLGWGAQRVVGGLCFCLGLVLVLVCGAELFTGNSLMVCALKSKKITLAQMLKAWSSCGSAILSVPCSSSFWCTWPASISSTARRSPTPW